MRYTALGYNAAGEGPAGDGSGRHPRRDSLRLETVGVAPTGFRTFMRLRAQELRWAQLRRAACSRPNLAAIHAHLCGRLAATSFGTRLPLPRLLLAFVHRRSRQDSTIDSDCDQCTLFHCQDQLQFGRLCAVTSVSFYPKSRCPAELASVCSHGSRSPYTQYPRWPCRRSCSCRTAATRRRSRRHAAGNASTP